MTRMSWAGLISAVAALMVFAMPAHAAATAPQQPLSAVQCTGSETTTYSPGVVFRPRNISLTTTGSFTSCLDTTSQVTAGAYAETFTLFAGCNNLLDDFTGQRVITWNTGATSVITGSGSSTAVLGQVITTFTGTVTQGLFQGSSVLQTITLPQPNTLKCLTTGITEATGITTLTLT
ncbi:hypothetical protein [Streptomyces sp. Wb2n-11]|uniref:hypothetical protein n=1 Tax=Streptomyces sp. Wb2n-11 TaxID=1030533 RepID=UPI000A45A3C9|nr:hypothetical protein [Streptomyces sp. Wb2n-11]